MLLAALAWPSLQDCALTRQIVTPGSYDNITQTANISITSFRDLMNPGCQAECLQALPSVKNNMCNEELITCRANTNFDPAICQPYISCKSTVGIGYLPTSDRFLYPTTHDSPVWGYQDYALSCDCPPHRYGPSCEMIRPGLCPITPNRTVWDGKRPACPAGIDHLRLLGTFINSAATTDTEVANQAKEAVCYLKAIEDQPSTGLTRTIVATIRHHRYNSKRGGISG